MIRLFNSPWICLVGVAYFPVASRLLFFFCHDDFPVLRRMNRFVGSLELFFGASRDVVLILVSLSLLGGRLFLSFRFFDAPPFPVELFFLVLSLYARWWRSRGLRPLQEFARLHPRVDPQEFMGHLYSRFGFLPHPLPSRPKSLINPSHLEFRENKGRRRSFLILLQGAYETFLFATLAYKAWRWGGNSYRRAGSGLALIFASRMAQLGKMEVKVEGRGAMERTKGGKRIFAVGHKSIFDFCLAPLAYFEENEDGSAADFIPIIMVAKDHFKDNFFLYRILNLGRMLEGWGMIFVDRKRKDRACPPVFRRDGAKRAVGDAVNKLLSSDIPFAIYPQGSRARGQFDREGNRWDAAYFCVGKGERLKKPGGHLKKGVAHVAVETAFRLHQQNAGAKVYILPVGMNGVGTSCPAKSLTIETGTSVTIKMGEPILVDPDRLVRLQGLPRETLLERNEYSEEAGRVLAEVDHSLRRLMDVTGRLKRRFLEDLEGERDFSDSEAVKTVFEKGEKEGDLLYLILDCIYALPQSEAQQFLKELIRLLSRGYSQDALEGLQDKIARRF